MPKPVREMQRRDLPASYELIRQGDHGDRAWLIESGQLEVVQTSPAGPRRLAVIGPGAIVGEMALIVSGVRSASVVTLSAVSALELTRDLFDTMIQANEPLAAYLLQSLVAAVRRAYGFSLSEHTEGGSHFRSVKTNARILDRRAFIPGHHFFNQGDEGTAAYLIQAGSVRIIQKTGEEVTELARLGPGRIFGELALIQNAPRRATVIAVEQTVCEVIRKDTFDRVIASMPPILRALTKIYVTQLSEAARASPCRKLKVELQRENHLQLSRLHHRPGTLHHA